MAALPQEQITPTVDADDLQALHQLVEKFDRNQLIWSSGYLAGLAGSTAPAGNTAPAIAAPESAPATETWHVFYATETGNSKTVAEQVVQQANTLGLATELHDLSTTPPENPEDD